MLNFTDSDVKRSCQMSVPLRDTRLRGTGLLRSITFFQNSIFRWSAIYDIAKHSVTGDSSWWTAPRGDWRERRRPESCWCRGWYPLLYSLWMVSLHGGTYVLWAALYKIWSFLLWPVAASKGEGWSVGAPFIGLGLFPQVAFSSPLFVFAINVDWANMHCIPTPL